MQPNTSQNIEKQKNRKTPIYQKLINQLPKLIKNQLQQQIQVNKSQKIKWKITTPQTKNHQ